MFGLTHLEYTRTFKLKLINTTDFVDLKCRVECTGNVSGGGGLETAAAGVAVDFSLDVEGFADGLCADKPRKHTKSKQHQRPRQCHGLER